MAQHHGVAESERQVDETVGGGVMEWTHDQVTLGILERRLTARSNRDFTPLPVRALSGPVP